MQLTTVLALDYFLMCCPPTDGQPEHKSDRHTHSHPRKQRVFVVDDERMIVDTLVEILTDRGFEAIPFYDSRQVIGRAEQHCPDILLTDVVMPHLNGVDLATLISERCPHTRVLLLSGQAATANLLQGTTPASKRFELLSKPLDPRVLLKKLAA
jgi:DNA-binding NtrC family response regulator